MNHAPTLRSGTAGSARIALAMRAHHPEPRPRRARSRRRLAMTVVATTVAAGAVLGFGAKPALAASGCAMDGTTLRIVLGADGDGITLSPDTDGRIRVWKEGQGTTNTTCAGGIPRTDNVDRVVVDDTSDGGSTEFKIYDPAEMGPGATSAGDSSVTNEREIEFDVDLGDGGEDELVVSALDPAPEGIVAGQSGVDFNRSDGTLADVDVITAGIDRMSLLGRGGGDLVSAAGGASAGLPLEIPTDLFGSTTSGGTATVLGGDGPDEIDLEGDEHIVVAGSGNDDVYAPTSEGSVDLGPGADSFEGYGDPATVFGGPGADTLTGGYAEDRLVGGPGRDTLLGGGGTDRLEARDGARDRLIDCGGGRDSARYDRGRDPKPRSCR